MSSDTGNPQGSSAKSQQVPQKSSSLPMDASPLVQGWVARESGIVPRLLNKRYAKLYPNFFVTFRKEKDEYPTKTWPITGNVDLTAVESGEYQLRNPGTSTLFAVARGRYENLSMWAFTVTWIGLVGGQHKLCLAFDTEDEAVQWHNAFSKAIGNAVNSATSRRTYSISSDVSTLATDADANESALGSRIDTSGTSERVSPSTKGDPSLQSTGSISRRQRGWKSVLHINGISVYVEDYDEVGDGGAIMVSAVVRAPPKDVFKHLMQVRKTEGLGVFVGARTLEVLDNKTQIVAQRWSGAGTIASLCAPREIVLLRTWRKDVDGTYIILYQSTNHRSMRKVKGWGWKVPVRANVQAAGFTISPLLPQYITGKESSESLVTMVLKADLGGYLSPTSVFGRYLQPLTDHAVRGMLEPIVTSLVVLRDHVEQNRFVVRPLTMSHGEEDSSSVVMDSSRIVTGKEQSQHELKRTTTMIVFGKDRSLAKAQEEAGVAVSPSLEEAAAKPEQVESDTTKMVDDSWAISGTCDKKYWSSPGNCGFKVRGRNYLGDKKKILAAPPMMELVAVDLLELDEPMYHVCRHLPSVKHSPAPFLFCVQLMVPSSPPVSLVCVWAAPMPMMDRDEHDLIAQFEKEQQSPCPDHIAAFFSNFAEFINGTGAEADKIRNTKLKLIPHISRGSWVIKQSVGTTPVILGTKLTTKYFRGKNYFEADVDIGASSVAASITNLVCGATKSLTLDMGILIEGQEPKHLPEQLIGTIRLDRLDLKSAAYLDETLGTVIKPDALHQ